MTVLTGCKSAEAQDQLDTSEIIKALAPDLPELPDWPTLEWQLEPSGRYSLSEADVDKVLDYWENRIPEYKVQLEIYADTLEIIMAHL